MEGKEQKRETEALPRSMFQTRPFLHQYVALTNDERSLPVVSGVTCPAEGFRTRLFSLLATVAYHELDFRHSDISAMLTIYNCKLQKTIARELIA